MAFYIIKEQKYFVDPHGSSDKGGYSYSVSEDESDYSRIAGKGEHYYTEYDEKPDWILESEHEGDPSEDGYNSSYETNEVKEITEEEYNRAKTVINDYYKLF